MASGEGIGVGVACLTVIAALLLFVEGMDWVARQWSAMIDRWPGDERDIRAEAMVPEYAAAVRQPEYRGGCRCKACRAFPKEPCSDFDGD
jgi:hypothetical protein